MKIYIAGKITGEDPCEVNAKFCKVEQDLFQKGHIALNPTVLPQGLAYEEYMHICFAMLDACDGIYLLSDWVNSLGAKREFRVAVEKHKSIFFDGDI